MKDWRIMFNKTVIFFRSFLNTLTEINVKK